MNDSSNIIFYDGHCALCHGFVRFVLKRDPEAKFHFAPIQGSTYQKLVTENKVSADLDSIALQTASGEFSYYSDAVILILTELPAPWPLIGKVIFLCPRGLRDLGYRMVAAVRKKVFGTKSELCPIIPEHLRARFQE